MPKPLSKLAPALPLLLLLLPASLSAEGARRFFDCERQQLCDAAGNCEAADGQLSFALEPLAVGSDGAGSYRLVYEENEVEMNAFSEAGPFRWSIGTEHHTLLASSESWLLWHRLDLSGAPTADIAFLSCKLRY
jgi:hypothetical protein